MESSRIRQYITTKQVPLDVILSLLMLSRAYLIARFMVLHSKQFQVGYFTEFFLVTRLLFFWTSFEVL